MPIVYYREMAKAKKKLAKRVAVSILAQESQKGSRSNPSLRRIVLKA